MDTRQRSAAPSDIRGVAGCSTNLARLRLKPTMICTMVSPDGKSWKRPELGLFEFRGSKKNNIIWNDGRSRITHMFAPFKDTRPGVPDDQRYKALAGSPIHALASSDGIHWRLLSEKPILTGTNFDSLNVAFWDARRKHYRLYCRHRLEGGVRFIATATSEDFLHWSERQPIDTGDGPVEHLYTNGTLPYFRAPHIYLSLAKRFMPERKRGNDGVSDAVLMSSRDGVHFDRTFREAWIRPGPTKDNWLARSNMPAWGIIQTSPEELSVYYSQNYGDPTPASFAVVCCGWMVLPPFQHHTAVVNLSPSRSAFSAASSCLTMPPRQPAV